jgi:hypothetical protein
MALLYNFREAITQFEERDGTSLLNAVVKLQVSIYM